MNEVIAQAEAFIESVKATMTEAEIEQAKVFRAEIEKEELPF